MDEISKRLCITLADSGADATLGVGKFTIQYRGGAFMALETSTPDEETGVIRNSTKPEVELVLPIATFVDFFLTILAGGWTSEEIRNRQGD